MSENYHKPVMLHESVDALNIVPGGTYVDVTFGGGGHSAEILNRLQGNGWLYAFDQDEDAVANAARFEGKNFTLVESNFRYLKRYLKLHRVTQVDGILADLGISSHQIDEATRGFSTRFDAELDMRMDQRQELSAKDVINEYAEEQLHKIFGMYGEVKNARTIASAIFKARTGQPIETIEQLKAVLSKYAPRGKENKYYAQVFQALRIEVNAELTVLEELLQQAADILKPGGRLVVISYHSLEDRIVKSFINKGKFYGEVEKDFYGNEIKPLQAVVRKPVEASAEEIASNNRARSAKLRIAEKL
jgi:16S rRNA (cytosine1402-N4)-methyltransferase